MRRAVPPLALLLVGALVAWIASEAAPQALAPSVDETATEQLPAAEEERTQRTRVRPDAPSPALTAVPRETETTRASFVLRVLTESREPVPGLAVHALGEVHRTDWAGAVTLPPPAGTLSPPTGTESEPTRQTILATLRAPDARRVELLPGENVIHVPPVVPLHVAWVDAETGEPLTQSTLAGGPPLVLSGEFCAPLWPGAAFDLEVAPVAPVEALGPHAAPRPDELRRTGRLSRYATSARMTVPVFRAMSVRARVVDDDGRPVAGARVALDDRSTRTAEDGRATLHGVRFARRGTYRVTAELGGLRTSASLTAPLSADRTPDVELALPPPSEAFEGPGVSGLIGRARSGRPGVRRPPQQKGHASLVIRVLRRDGTPAAGARVGVSGPWRGGTQANELGMARFSDLPAGEYRVTSSEVGLNGMVEHVTLGEAETRRIVMSEPLGRTVRVEVVDAAGRALPSARISFVDSVSSDWVHMHAGSSQSLDLFTDGRGRLTLEHFPARAFIIRAAYGGRVAELRVLEGEPARITIPD